MKDIDWSKSHCGVYLCDYATTIKLMPEVEPILIQLSGANDWRAAKFWKDKLIDVKVHMLMPKQFPCIPNWHYDFRPRNESGVRLLPADATVGTGEKLWAWISGPPFTEFYDENQVIQQSTPNEWHDFTQDDLHRGSAATEHCWRCFIRVIPAHLAHACMPENVGQIRRHTQVYLDSEDFNW